MKVEIENRSGQKLSAYLERSLRAHGHAVFAHCFTCSKDLKAAKRITEMLADRGFNVLRFDFTGLGQSDGDFSDTTFETNMHDLEDVVQWMRAEDMAPVLLVGHSLGGAAVLNYAAHDSAIQAVATYGAPSRPEHIIQQFGCVADQIIETGSSKVKLAGREFLIRKAFIDAAERVSAEYRHKKLNIPTLLMHAPSDETVAYEHAVTLRDEIGDMASLVRVERGDHLLTRDKDALFVGQQIALWAERALNGEVDDERNSIQSVDSVQAVDRSTLPDVRAVTVDGYHFRTRLQAGTHIVYADEPIKLHGDDSGMAPFELLQSALGACTAMTLRMYSERKGWDLGRIQVDLVGGWVEPEDSECHEEAPKRMYQIQREITVSESLEEAQLTRLEEIAGKCPVHKALHQPAEILTYVKGLDT